MNVLEKNIAEMIPSLNQMGFNVVDCLLKFRDALVARKLGAKAAPGLRGNDLIVDGVEVELKSLDTSKIKNGFGITTPSAKTLRRYRECPYFLFATLDKQFVQTIWKVSIEDLEPYFQSWRGKKGIQYIPLSYVDKVGEVIFDQAHTRKRQRN